MKIETTRQYDRAYESLPQSVQQRVDQAVPTLVEAYDQGGNVWEWNEAVIGSSRGLRGGSWDSDESRLRASLRFDSVPSLEVGSVGFRVAGLLSVVPEPAVGGLILLGGALLWRRRR